MTERDKLRKILADEGIVRGWFTLSSGEVAEWYADLRRVLLRGGSATLAGQVMLDITGDLGYQAVGGLTLGADPVALAMMHVASSHGHPLDAFIVRKERKPHGLQKRIEGPDVSGCRVLVVEDTCTTGNSAMTAVEALLEAGAQVVGVAAVLDRGGGVQIEKAGLPFRAAFTPQDIGIG